MILWYDDHDLAQRTVLLTSLLERVEKSQYDYDDDHHQDGDGDDQANFYLVLSTSVLRQNQTDIRNSITTISQRRKYYNSQLMFLYEIKHWLVQIKLKMILFV